MPMVKRLKLPEDNYWYIAEEGGRIYFHAFSHIICYDGKQMITFINNKCTSGLFQAGGRIFFQWCGTNELFEIEGGKFFKVAGNSPLKGEMKFMGEIAPHTYVICEADGSVFRYYDGKIQFIKKILNEDGKAIRVDCGALNGKRLAIGTIGEGIFIIDLATGRLEHLPSNRLQDKNVHGLIFADKNYLWASLDNGVSAINMNPLTFLWKQYNEVGSFFDAAIYKGEILIATNQGLFNFKNGRKMTYNLFPLRLYSIKDELLIGTTKNLYRIDSDGKIFQLGDINGVSQFEYVASNGKECLFVVSYSGLGVIHYFNGAWQHEEIISGGDIFSQIMPEDMHCLWANNAEKGLFRLKLNKKLTKVQETKKFNNIAGYDNLSRLSIFRAEGHLLFATPKGIYTYNIANNNFDRQEKLSKKIIDLNTMISIVAASDNTFWMLTRQNLFLYEIRDMQVKLVKELPIVGDWLLQYDKHVNLQNVNDSLTFISTSLGTMVINNSKLNNVICTKGRLHIESVRHIDYEGVEDWLTFSGSLTIPERQMDTQIYVSCGLSADPIFISYRILGFNDRWSEWSESGRVNIPALGPGSYVMEIRGSNGDIVKINIYVTPPFYLSWWMILIYILLLIIIVTFVVLSFSNRRHHKVVVAYEEEQKRLSEEIKRKEYDNLQKKVNIQKNELKERLRFLTQKQELIENISLEVDRQKKELGERWPNKLYIHLKKIIDNGASEMDRKLSMEDYFVDVHHEFMLRMQEKHPNLSPSELKFCCLLRANLSTKEMAAIMGIGARSVELRKYRLKQSLNLDKDDRLVNYMLSI
jgi:AraC family chitin signaling transcriptional activator